MNEGKGKTIRVAAIQMVSENGNIDKNLAHAVKFVEEAAQKGAKLIALPEFMATGYKLTKDIWDAGEPKNGPTVTWLKENSKRLGVYIGASYLEADSEDFFNTFVLTNPSGEEAGRVRKQTPASMEACFTKGEAGSHMIDTKFGKIGVGICYENWLSYMPQLMHTQSVDIMLMPSSAPTFPPSKFMKSFVNGYNSILKSLPTYYSKLLGIPIVSINKCGLGPVLPMLSPRGSRFPGFSAITNADGSLKVQMGDEEGVIVEDVTLDPALKVNTPPLCRGRWAMDVPLMMKSAPFNEAILGIYYALNADRKRRARIISKSNT
jgi:N-carbamoylputrescine amidase